jgi:Fe-S cluster assembly ATPase SufC
MPLEHLTKVCTKCGIEKGLTEFSPDKRAKLGRHAWCKPCNINGIKYQQAYRLALRALSERHATEFEHLLLLARRGELQKGGA